MANMGGTYLLLIYGLLGLRLEKQLRIAPAYQNHFKEISIGILYQGIKIKIHVKDHVVTVISDKPIRIRLFDEDILVEGQHSELIKNA
jgi:alpha,alpha-trehalose phosphorylase